MRGAVEGRVERGGGRKGGKRGDLGLTCGAVSSGELDRQEAARGDTFRLAPPAVEGAGLEGEVGQDRPGGAWAGLWLPSESLPCELGGVGGICSGSRPAEGPELSGFAAKFSTCITQSRPK